MTWRTTPAQPAPGPYTSLIIEGDAANNNISVQVSGGTIQFIADGNPVVNTVAAGSVGLLRISGSEGNDTIVLQPSLGTLPSQLFGNDGDDNLTGGAGQDLIRGGLGSDTLSGGGGNDRLQFGPNDSFNGGLGKTL